PENAGGRFEIVDGRARVIAEHVYDAALISNTDPLPPVYRIQITVSNIDAGGRNIDPATGREINNSDNSIAAWTDTDGVYNGLRNLEPGTNPWRPNMDTNAVGSTGSTNGMYFLAIGDYFNPMPNNNDFIHHRRKIAMDVNSHRSDPWSGIWCPEEERHVMDGSRYVSMIWLTDAWRTANVAPENGGWGAGTPLTPGPASGQWLGGPHTTITVNTGTMGWGQRNTWLNNGNPFYTYTQVGRHYGAWDTFMVDKYLPDEAYIFTVERTPEYFRLSVSGYFAIGGETTYTHTKFHLPDNDPTSPRFNMGQGTWRFNQTPEELQGWEPHSAIVRFENANTGEYLYYETWPTDTGNPCFFFFGLPHVQHYIATADFDDLKLWVAEEYAYRFPADPSWTTPDPGPGTGGGGGGGGGPLPTPTPPAPDYELHLAYMFGNAQGNFRPTANLTRAEAATILARTQLLEFEEGISTLPPGMTSFTAFSDVQPNNWFFYYVAWAYDADLVQGSGGRFRPNDPVTREEFAAMMARTMDVRPAGALPFPDAGSISNWARAYVYTVYRAGVMVGDAQGNFNPDANISRAEVATAMNRVLGRIDSRAALYAADVENLAHARRFPDVATTTWYFPSVVAAANDHRLTRDDDGAIDWKEIIR
ncbi:MAG: S-layer homology domain-containing protein, partial [Oscillospiraceae bacterium]|nr:S-layer homology domain-containing protein [Oscillospiraceae bacterium]